MKKLWLLFAVVVMVSFGVLGWVGTRIYQQAPPIPEKVLTSDGRVLITGNDIQEGQNIWQASVVADGDKHNSFLQLSSTETICDNG